MKLAGQVRRPFHGRSVVLVYMWYHLALGKDVKNGRESNIRHAISTCVSPDILDIHFVLNAVSSYSGTSSSPLKCSIQRRPNSVK